MSDLSGMYRSECANCKALRARVAELEAANEIELLRVVAKNAAILLEWLSAERSAHACDDREAVEGIRSEIVEARRTLSLSIKDANRHCANIPTAAEWENWRE